MVVFEEGNPLRPIVLGIIQSAAQPDRKVSGLTGSQSSFVGVVESDGERIVFEAEREIVLRCGEASITLTRAGKILLRGKYLLSRSSGVNRIKGGSVQIN